MRAQSVSKAQQLKYVLECRSSGLTDYQWCNEHGIHPGTFYNWVSKLKKSGCTDIPDPVSRLGHKSVRQEVVRLNVIQDKPVVGSSQNKIDQNACFSSADARDSVVEIVLPNATIRFVNNTDPVLFRQALMCLGGELC